MHPTIDKPHRRARSASRPPPRSPRELDRHKLAWGGLALAAIILLAVNLFASTALPRRQGRT